MNNAPTLDTRIANLAHRASKDKLRFAVRNSKAGHASIWYAWSQGNEFYIASNDILAKAKAKISLHQTKLGKTGYCQFAIEKQAVASINMEVLPKPNDRVFVKWMRPAAPEYGAHLAVVLRFPTDYLRLPAPQGTKKKPILIFEANEPGKATEIDFLFSREDAAKLEQKFVQLGKPAGRWKLPNGESVSLVAQEVDFDPKTIPSEPVGVGNLWSSDSTASPILSWEPENVTAIYWNNPQDEGPLVMLEVGGTFTKT